jgi:hypothetical protein
MFQNSSAPALERTWTPFWTPIQQLGESGSVLYLGHGYRADDTLALVDISRFVPAGCHGRVRFQSMPTRIQTVLSIKEMQTALGEKPSKQFLEMAIKGEAHGLVQEVLKPTEKKSQGLCETFWPMLYAFAAKSSEPAESGEGRPAFADSENLLIIGRPEYYAAWWVPPWPFRELVCRAGYPGRYAFPDRGGGQPVAQPSGNEFFDRKWLLQHQHAKGHQMERDFGLILHNQVRWGGMRRRITLCLGCHALGTWAAARFAVDPAFFRQLAGSDSLDGKEYPLEILLKVERPDGSHGGALRDLALTDIIILNNHPEEFIGQVFDPSCDSCARKKKETGPCPGLDRPHSVRPVRRFSDVGRSLHDLGTILPKVADERGTIHSENQVAKELHQVLTHLVGARETLDPDPYGVWQYAGDVQPDPATWKMFAPDFESRVVANEVIEITLNNGTLNLGEERPLVMGPRLFAFIWQVLSSFRRYKPKEFPRRPI